MVPPESEDQKLSTTFHLFSMRDLDFVCLKLIFAQLMSLSRPWSIHMLPATDVVTVISSMKCYWGLSHYSLGKRAPAIYLCWQSTKFMARLKRMTELMLHVTIPFSSRCQFDVPDPAWTFKLNSLQYSRKRPLILLGMWCWCRETTMSLCGKDLYAFASCVWTTQCGRNSQMLQGSRTSVSHCDRILKTYLAFYASQWDGSELTKSSHPWESKHFHSTGW